MASSPPGTSKSIPVSVFTGFLGAGKTTIILDIIQRVKSTAPTYSIAILKNEFGDVQVDSLLAQESAIQVTEMLNGCLCCVLVGQMETALKEMKGTLSTTFQLAQAT
jgi:G3E family GTPase